MTGYGTTASISTVTEMISYGMTVLYLLLLLGGLVICVIHRRVAPGMTLLMVGFALEMLGWLLSVGGSYLIRSGNLIEPTTFEQWQRIYICIRLVTAAGLGFIVWGLAAVFGDVRRRLKFMGRMDGADDIGRRGPLPFDADQVPRFPGSADIQR
jgi:hypothetical protein